MPREVRVDPEQSYRFSPIVRLVEGTIFNQLIRALAKSNVYYDPDIKLDKASTSKPEVKREDQFRTKSGDMEKLYSRYAIFGG